MNRITTDGVLLTGHKGTAVEVPFDPADEWGTREEALWPDRNGHPVEVALNGVRFRSAIVSRMRRFFVLVDESMARRAPPPARRSAGAGGEGRSRRAGGRDGPSPPRRPRAAAPDRAWPPPAAPAARCRAPCPGSRGGRGRSRRACTAGSR